MNKSEHAEQTATCEWFHLQYKEYRGSFFAIPNGGARHPAVAVKLRSEGVMRGVFDLFLMVPKHPYHGLFIEMKAKGGSMSKHQKLFMQRAQAMGFKAVVCFGFDEARAAISEYLA